MALKDWKKINEYSYKKEWENKKNKDFLKIQEGKDYTNNKEYWEVKLGKYNEYIIKYEEIAKFNSKSEAMAYARAFMVKN